MSRIPIRSLSETVAQRIRDMIRRGVLKKGDRIVEKQLCDALGVSRTPLREALRILKSEGLIDLVPNKGAHVAQPSMQDIRELFEVMSILEGACARTASEKMNEADFARLVKLHQKLEKHFEKKDHEKYLEVNHKFHSLIQEIAGNKLFNEILGGLRQKILLYRQRQLFQPDRFQASMEEHRWLLEALRNRDADSVESLMKTHLMKQCEALRTLYEEAGGHADS
ncbi:MAG: GntR family transcriptional regulator [Pseudomonadota bacterium]